MELSIRRATLRDMPELHKLFVETIRNIASRDYDPDQIRIWTASIQKKKRWEDAVLNQYFILLEKEDQLLGFGSLDQGNYIDFMYVHKDYQGQGIASLIYQELLEEARRQGETRLSSDVSKTARPFFEKKGFKAVKENIMYIEGIEIRNYRMINHTALAQ